MLEDSELFYTVKDVLLQIGISANLSGALYIFEAIKLTISEPTILTRMGKDLYPKIANKYNNKPANIERAIRHAIEVSTSKGKLIKLNEIFNLSLFVKQEKPCNGEFISILAQKVTMLAGN